MQPGSLLLGGAGDTSDVTGIVMLASGPVLIDSSAILTSNSDGPSAGRLIMGRSLDADETVRLGGMTHMPVEIERMDSGNMPSDFRAAADRITDENPDMIRPDAQDSLAAYQELHDIYGKPVAILRVLLPRKIYQQGQNSLLQFLLLLIAAGLVFGAVTMYLLERFVISRVGHLSDDITQIGASGDLGARLQISGHDELANLGATINSMLEDLEIGPSRAARGADTAHRDGRKNAGRPLDHGRTIADYLRHGRGLGRPGAARPRTRRPADCSISFSPRMPTPPQLRRTGRRWRATPSPTR